VNSQGRDRADAGKMGAIRPGKSMSRPQFSSAEGVCDETVCRTRTASTYKCITVPRRNEWTRMSVITRFAVGVCVALLESACDRPVSDLSWLARPTQTTTAPTPTVYTVTGVVSEGARPIEGASVGAWIGSNGSGYVYGCCTGAWIGASKAGYVQQCAAPQVTVLGDTRVDVQLVSKANLSASTAQAPVAGLRAVSGVIFEVTGAGKQPVAGAYVDFDPIGDYPMASTFSDAAGRYLLCGVPEGQTAEIRAYTLESPPRVTSVSVPSGQSTGIDITLP
jgi:hypothetical protein